MAGDRIITIDAVRRVLRESGLRLIMEWLVLPTLIGFLLFRVVQDHYTLNALILESANDEVKLLLHSVEERSAAKLKAQVALINTERYRGIIDRLNQTTYTVTVVANNNDSQPLKSGETLPLHNWSDYISNYTLNQCVCGKQATAPQTTAELMRNKHITAFITCPLLNENYHLLGTVSLDWISPPPENLEQFLPLVRYTSHRIVRYLTLRSKVTG